jgi:hypothetical protein
MERHSLFAALTDAVGSLLINLADNALKRPSVAALTSLRSTTLAECDRTHDHAAICRSGGKTPGTFAVAMPSETAEALAGLVLGEIGDVTPTYTASFLCEFTQWVANRALPRLGVTDFDFLPESVTADSLGEYFSPNDDSTWLRIECEIGQLHVGANFDS